MAQDKVFEGCPETASVEELLSTPICWRGQKTCDFFRAIHNSIKDNHSPTINDFKSKLVSDGNSLKWNLWNSHQNWKSVLGQEHFDLVTKHFSNTVPQKGVVSAVKVKTYKTKVKDNSSAVELLQVIRNKHEHNKQFEDAEKEKLNWFIKTDGKWKFDDRLYATYWNSNFPRLEYFLWEHFYEFRDSPTLQKFYYHEKILELELLELPVTQSTLQSFASSTGRRVEMRYSLGNAYTIDFRTDFGEWLHKLLDGSTTVQVILSLGKVTCKWYEKGALIDEKVTSFSCDRNETCSSFEAILFFVNMISDLNTNVINFVLDKVTIFTRESCHYEVKAAAEELVSEISCMHQVNYLECIVGWKDLGQTVRGNVEESGKCEFQNKEINLKGVLPENVECRNRILSKLRGEFLNQLLRKQEPTMLRKLELPSVSEIYIERRLYNCDILHPIIIHKCSREHVFLVTNVSNDALKYALKAKPGFLAVIDNDKDLAEIDIKNNTTRVFLVKSHLMESYGKDLYRRSYDNSEGVYCKTIHFLCYINRNRLKWLGTLGSFTQVEDFFIRAAKKVGTLSEEKMLEKLDQTGKHEKIIFIGDKPVMGKSQVLTSLAGKLAKKYRDRFVLFFTMNKFMDRLKARTGKRKFVMDDIIGTLVDLSCSSEFESELILFWLMQGISVDVKLELMLDGLDELQVGMKRLAFDLLKLIRDELHVVRVWVTLREHMSNDVRSRFQRLGYKLVPFARSHQVKFLTSFWKKEWKKGENDFSFTAADKKLMINFARECIKSVHSEQTQISGIPLQCKMIAEINMRKISKILSDGFNSEFSVAQPTHSLIGLYRKMLRGKLQVYLQEKNNLNVQVNHAAIKPLREEIERAQIYLSIKLIFSEDVANTFWNLLKPMNGSVNMSILLNIGVVQKICPLSFIHRTFAEFIVALFIYNVLTGQCRYVSVSDPIFQNFLWKEIFSGKYEDEDDFFYMSFNTESEFKFPAVCQFLNDLLQEHKRKPHVEVNGSLRNALRIQFNSWVKFVEMATLFATASCPGYENIFDFLVKSERQMIQLFIIALECQTFELCKYLIENHPQFGPSNWYKISEFDESKYGILHYAVKGALQYEPKEFVYNNYSYLEKDDEVDRDNYDTYTIKAISRLKDFFGFIVEKDRRVLELQDADGRTPLLLLLKLGSNYFYPVSDTWIDLIRIFVNDLAANIHAIDNEGNTVLHITHDCDLCTYQPCLDSSYLNSIRLQYVEIFEFFTKNGYDRRAINYLNNRGNSPLLQAVHSLGDNIFLILDVFEKLGGDFNLKDSDGNTALHILIEKNFDWRIIPELIRFGADISIVNDKCQSALHLAVAKENFMVVKMLVEKFHADLCTRDGQGRRIMDYKTPNQISGYLQKCLFRKRCRKAINAFMVCALLTCLIAFIVQVNEQISY